MYIHRYRIYGKARETNAKVLPFDYRSEQKQTRKGNSSWVSKEHQESEVKQPVKASDHFNPLLVDNYKYNALLSYHVIAMS